MASIAEAKFTEVLPVCISTELSRGNERVQLNAAMHHRPWNVCYWNCLWRRRAEQLVLPAGAQQRCSADWCCKRLDECTFFAAATALDADCTYSRAHPP
jgi:hypothetical protein